jgi:hypothetical protein
MELPGSQPDRNPNEACIMNVSSIHHASMAVILQHQEGVTAQQAADIHPAFFAADLGRLNESLWMLAGHTAGIPNVGDFYFALHPLNTLVASKHFVVLAQFVPVSAERTHVMFTGLVSEAAREGIDYDVDRLTASGDVTTRQVERVIANNQAGEVRFFRWYEGLSIGTTTPC